MQRKYYSLKSEVGLRAVFRFMYLNTQSAGNDEVQECDTKSTPVMLSL